jgi:hypothetical protein
MLPFLTAQETPARFVEQHAPSLKECSCILMTRAFSNNARDYLDHYSVELFKQKKWPKDQPIKIMDVGSGDLKQLATSVTSLVNSGYKVELVLVDAQFEVLYQEQDTDKSAQVKAKLKVFNDFLQLLNDKAQTANAVVLKGLFSSLDSFKATIQGKCLQYEHCETNEVLRARLKAGLSRRYLSTALGKETVERVYGWKNHILKREYEANKALCSQLFPDLILVIDDVTEFYAQGVGKLAIEATPAETLEYAFNNELAAPFSQVSQPPTILFTKKTMISSHEGRLQVGLIESSTPQRVLYEYRCYAHDRTNYMIVGANTPCSKTADVGNEPIASRCMHVLEAANNSNPQSAKILHQHRQISASLKKVMAVAIDSLSSKCHLSLAEKHNKKSLLTHYEQSYERAESIEEIKSAVMRFIKTMCTPRDSGFASFFTSAFAETASAQAFKNYLKQNPELKIFIYSLLDVDEARSFKELANVVKERLAGQPNDPYAIAQSL